MLALLRIIAIFFYFLLINLLLILVCVLRPFHRDNVHAAGVLYSSVSSLLGLKLEVRVPDSVKQGGPYVFIANHQNSFDLLTICAAAQKGTVTVGKKSLIWIPIIGQVYWLTGNIMIDRKHSGRAHDTLQDTVQKIQKRRLSVWFFPEGTRSNGRGLLPFKTGAFRIAKATNEPIVMVTASSLHNKIKLNRWDNGTLVIQLSEPEFINETQSVKYNAEYFHRKMQQQITQINTEVDNKKV
ncbi:1-acylglycerol-3-phosphate O-acyltransferase [Paraglaciecola arctica]|uniref:1-acylglycerol-3-phosphate O-acyltransferase n=1 Tax=Paraglaciecola arctica TaxID=1128911 RepID=UPI001C0741FE|nr:1-acylglycerol-3-phosphate O-acyltransferase [Paraglaciecola arctica]MBU3004020.1 1-acylglycerol-3-phosphate O-acyltransferase [Paraglaciecola arctica]